VYTCVCIFPIDYVMIISGSCDVCTVIMIITLFKEVGNFVFNIKTVKLLL